MHAVVGACACGAVVGGWVLSLGLGPCGAGALACMRAGCTGWRGHAEGLGGGWGKWLGRDGRRRVPACPPLPSHHHNRHAHNISGHPHPPLAWVPPWVYPLGSPLLGHPLGSHLGHLHPILNPLPLLFTTQIRKSSPEMLKDDLRCSIVVGYNVSSPLRLQGFRVQGRSHDIYSRTRNGHGVQREQPPPTHACMHGTCSIRMHACTRIKRNGRGSTPRTFKSRRRAHSALCAQHAKRAHTTHTQRAHHTRTKHAHHTHTKRAHHAGHGRGRRPAGQPHLQLPHFRLRRESPPLCVP